MSPPSVGAGRRARHLSSGWTVGRVKEFVIDSERVSTCAWRVTLTTSEIATSQMSAESQSQAIEFACTFLRCNYETYSSLELGGGPQSSEKPKVATAS